MIKKEIKKLHLVEEPIDLTPCVRGGDSMLFRSTLKILLNSTYGTNPTPITELKTWGDLNEDYEIEYR